ncbi:TPA: mobilization protein [Escherichia coli]|uniref:plasmid mobilization protein n=1 Tax=Escherichia coli TaxID=562 RepID=UPI000DA4C483|nr:mobilization protein [Escherichia coli]EHU7964817.1 mobilization protein [Escherichia coli]MBW0078023.1 mobilization protein [Escherichia coli]MCV7892624.1 mobilization protein [Escherichia coli]SRB30894.1 putative plasmid conjugation system NikA protein [Escherichia coli]HAM6774360.1 mobilization protein [Escherichia coli]
MVKNKRSGSERRQRNKVYTVRLNKREAREISRRAKDEDMTISAYIRHKVLNYQYKQYVPEKYLTEIVELGRKQKKLFDDGMRTKDEEYLAVMKEIIDVCNKTNISIQNNHYYYKQMDLINEEIRAIKKAHNNKYPVSNLFK